MKKLALAVAAVATLGFAAPVFAAQSAPATHSATHSGIHAAKSDVSAQRRVVKKVIVRRGPAMHRGWYGRPRVSKRVVIKQRPNGTTVRKVFRNGMMTKKVIRR